MRAPTNRANLAQFKKKKGGGGLSERVKVAPIYTKQRQCYRFLSWADFHSALHQQKKKSATNCTNRTDKLVRGVYSGNWPMRVQWAPLCNFRGPPERYLNFFVQSIQKQLKKVQNTNTETNEEKKGNLIKDSKKP